MDGARVGRFTIGGGRSSPTGGSRPSEPKNPLQDADEALQVRVPLKAGLRQVVATIVKSDGVKPEGLGPDRIPIWSRESDVPERCRSPSRRC